MRKCPVDNSDVQDACQHTSCLANYRRAKHCCIAQHIHRTDITVHDVAYIRGKSLRATKMFVNQGLDKITAFVDVLRECDDLNGARGCFRCGNPNDHTEDSCKKGAAQILLYSASIPLEAAAGHLSPAIWFRLLNRPNSKIHTCFDILAKEL